MGSPKAQQTKTKTGLGSPAESNLSKPSRSKSKTGEQNTTARSAVSPQTPRSRGEPERAGEGRELKQMRVDYYYYTRLLEAGFFQEMAVHMEGSLAEVGEMPTDFTVDHDSSEFRNCTGNFQTSSSR